MDEICVCDEHIDIGIEKILDLNKLPLVEEIVETKMCALCDELSRYKVKSGDDFES